MKLPNVKLAVIATALLLDAASGHADPPPADVMRCTVTLPSGVFVAAFDFTTMRGTFTSDGALGSRRFKVKAAPYSGTYNLLFQGYGAGDTKPAAESMKKGKSIVARVVAYGEVQHLFLDSDYRSGVTAPSDGFICQ
jgi:hypothetical protein